MNRRLLNAAALFAALILFALPSRLSAQVNSVTPPKDYRPQVSPRVAAAVATATNDVLLIEDFSPWASTSNEDILNSFGISYKKIAISDVSTETLSNYNKVIIAGDQTSSFYTAYMTYRSKFDSYVKGGGTLEWHLCGFGWNGGDSSGVVMPGSVATNGLGLYLNYNDVALPSHALVNGVSSPFWGSFASHGYFTNFANVSGLQIVTTQGAAAGYWPTLIQYPYGKGCVIASTQPLEFGYRFGQSTGIILSNMIPYNCSKGTGASQKGYVITIDGTHIISVLNPSYPPDATHYLYDAIDPYWTGLIESRVGTITHFDWSRNIYDTDDYVVELSAVLEGLTKLSKKNHSPLVVLSHSWGTVLAYIAISHNKNIVVDKFVTLGSPLNAQNGTVNAFTKDTLARWNINKISSPNNVRTWSNYWAQCDPISGSIQATKGDYKITTNYIDNEFLTCHAAYFADYGVWQQILFDVYLTK